MWTRFEVVKAVAEHIVCCGGCGKKAKRRKTFECTINPFNRNEDGTVKTKTEVQAQAQAKADKWVPKPYLCKECTLDGISHG